MRLSVHRQVAYNRSPQKEARNVIHALGQGLKVAPGHKVPGWRQSSNSVHRRSHYNSAARSVLNNFDIVADLGFAVALSLLRL